MPYSTAADLLARTDSRILGDLCNDSGSRVTPTALLTDSNVAAALSDAAGRINAAALVSQRYTVAELQALTGDDAAMLVRLNCDLAFCYLVERRGVTGNTLYDVAHERAVETLTALEEGKLMFNVAADVSVGTPAEEFPDAITYRTVGILRDQAWRLYPVRRPMAPASGGFST